VNGGRFPFTRFQYPLTETLMECVLNVLHFICFFLFQYNFAKEIIQNGIIQIQFTMSTTEILGIACGFILGTLIFKGIAIYIRKKKSS